MRERIELCDGFAERRGDVLVGCLAEADVAVADLCKENALLCCVIGSWSCLMAKLLGRRPSDPSDAVPPQAMHLGSRAGRFRPRGRPE